MKEVFYITREGKSCRTAGIKAYTQEIKNLYDMTGELIFYQGTAYNIPEHLAELIKKDPEAVIILSMPDCSAYISGKDNLSDNVVPALEHAGHKTSWEVLYEIFRKENR